MDVTCYLTIKQDDVKSLQLKYIYNFADQLFTVRVTETLLAYL